jgi:hypothetical protein
MITNCQKCGNKQFARLTEDTIVCIHCNTMYKLQMDNNLVDLTKCEICNSWYFKEKENLCDCRKIGYIKNG